MQAVFSTPFHSAPPPQFNQISINLNSRQPIGEFANKASEESHAVAAMNAVRCEIGDGKLIRKLNTETGEGFWDITIPELELRVVSYGPGEYVQPHYHDIYERFTIKSGSCHLWVSQDKGKNWEYSHCNQELDIPGGAWHCLLADQRLVMEVVRDDKRDILWLTKGKHTASWSKTLDYEVKIEDLVAATRIKL